MCALFKLEGGHSRSLLRKPFPQQHLTSLATRGYNPLLTPIAEFLASPQSVMRSLSLFQL